MEQTLEDALLLADVAAKQNFQGLSNTEELKETVLEMFTGCTETIILEHVQGSTKEFRCTLLSEARSCESVDSILSTFERNTFITMKKSKYL